MSFKMFDAPVPGQSLTQEAGSAPYEQPPQFANVEDALENIFEKLSDKRHATRLVLLLRKGVPVEYLTRTMLYEGFLKNKWTPDTALLMGRIVMAMIIAVGTQAGVKKMKLFNPDKEQDKFLEQFLGDDSIFEDANEEAPSEEEKGFLGNFTGLLGAKL